MKTIKYEKFANWLVNNGFKHDPSRDVKFPGAFVRVRKVFIKDGSKEYYIVNVYTKTSSRPGHPVKEEYVGGILHGMNVDTISSIALIDTELVKPDLRKTFWKQMCN